MPLDSSRNWTAVGMMMPPSRQTMPCFRELCKCRRQQNADRLQGRKEQLLSPSSLFEGDFTADDTRRVVDGKEVFLCCLTSLSNLTVVAITRPHKYDMTTRSWITLSSVLLQPMRSLATEMSATVRAVPRKKLASTRSAITMVSLCMLTRCLSIM